MPDDLRIRHLVEEILESRRTPEEVCSDTPELLPAVRKRLEQVQCVGYKLDEIFPADGPTRRDGAKPRPDLELPAIRGYEVQEILGRGGMGVVFKARQLKLNRMVALKMLLAGAYAGAEELARFQREAEAVALLRHPNIVQVYDAGDMEGRPYLTMEYVEGGTLAHSLASTPQPPRRAAELIATLASAVQFAHQGGFIHRDLKPANILLQTGDCRLQIENQKEDQRSQSAISNLQSAIPKITDFGLARSIHESTQFTESGARLGTPSYMAPEQAAGNASAIGPAVDIYALGAVLYEMLTGRPPLEGRSQAETVQKVIAEEPLPPSRVNPQVPRDLETICLKCLQKSPTRRYPSAQDLADDLHRFLDGKPVLARPIGTIERMAKWVRRRPTLATLLAVLLLSLGTASVTGIVLWHEENVRQMELQHQANVRQMEADRRREQTRQAIETPIKEAYELARAERWEDAQRILDNVPMNLADVDLDDLRQKMAQARKDVHFGSTLDQIRQQAVYIDVEKKPFRPATAYSLQTAEFRKAFAESPFNIDGPAEETASLIRASPLAAHTIAALDVWALAAFMANRGPLQEKLLLIARLADPDPNWGDRFRTPAVWHDKYALRQLADDAFKLRGRLLPSSHQLSITACLLRKLGEGTMVAGSRDVNLLKRAWPHRPADFWLNLERANTLTLHNEHKEAIEYYRVAIALRPGNVWIHGQIAASLILDRRPKEGIEYYQTAVALAPRNGPLRHGLVLALCHFDVLDKALAECTKGIDADPSDPWPPFSRGVVLALHNRNEEASDSFRKACQLNATWAVAHQKLAASLERCGRPEDALAALRDHAALEKSSTLAPRRMGNILMKLGRHEEAVAQFERIVRELDPGNQLREFDFDDSADTNYESARLGLAESLLCLGRFQEAKMAAAETLKLPELGKSKYQQMQRCLDIGEGLTSVEGELPALCSGTKQFADLAKQLLLAEWLYRYKRCTVASVRAYESAFARPEFAGDVRGQHRFNAACAAVLAGSGRGGDTAKLTEQEKSVLRAKAKNWLTAEWEKLKNGDPADRLAAANDWQKNDDLAAVRDGRALAELPIAEQTEWQELWAAMKPRPLNAKVLAQARAQVDRKQWAEAAKNYALVLGDTHSIDGEIWYEHAAVQLLSGDRAGYGKSCKFMLETGQKSNSLEKVLARTQKMRGYHVARACTLAADENVDVTSASKVSSTELQFFAKEFWSQTQQGALLCRLKQFKQALPMFENSLRKKTRPGAAVLNWLWLAQAHHQLGQTTKARSYLDKACAWLDSVGSELPRNADALNLHRHNWLEAHILRREVEALLMLSR